MLTSIKGRSAIVTGGSKGIGRGIAQVFAEQGARVTIIARDEAALKDAAREMGDNVRYAVADVTDWDAVQHAVAGAVAAQGGLDIVCANAGAYPETRIADMDVAEWDAVMAVNLRSSFLAVKAAIPHFEAAGKGRVVLISSITGPITGYPGWSHYGAAKAGQMGFLRSAAIELAQYGTTINAVLPGNILTHATDTLGPEYVSRMAATIPLGRLGGVRDIGNAVLFLASDEAGYITGQQIVVDGGQTLPETPDAVGGS